MKTEQIQRTRGTFYIVKVKNDFKQKSKSILAGEVEMTRLNYRLWDVTKSNMAFEVYKFNRIVTLLVGLI